ncbi:MAG: exodeoxyribonuclease III [Anaerolineae bacterium]|nr:exodeoxyribonuclease III [Anaerolineae bacterium]
MKITTWNVNGFRAVLNKGFIEWVNEFQPDILCLQETKAKIEQINDAHKQLSEYETYWNSAIRPGYSGVASFIKGGQYRVINGLGIEMFDKEGRVIRIESDEHNFVLFNIYFPNGQRDQERLDYKLAFYNALLEICDQLHNEGKNIIITGDFNTAHNDIDLANPKENSKTSGFLPEERAWIDKYLEHRFMDAFRVLYPEDVKYTWWTYRFNARKRNIGWRLDYFLVSENLMPRINKVFVHDDIEGSDHCPVTLFLD